MRTPAREYFGKLVISQTGKKFGIVSDLVFDKKTGEIVFLVIKEPTPHLEKYNLEKDIDGSYLIPFSAVRSIGDFVVIDESEL
ncbi:NEQ314 [Nanoarchaeum equitans Kin4-M]|uniref:NEQ314 n=1 Tax=Nanoarchaeum equitans (strain Kin4-M) TaxID=228908 RepID=Q74NH8_NANEQ|nr:NEQ314 [Nanoarchaeum equitans Kin4-M]